MAWHFEAIQDNLILECIGNCYQCYSKNSHAKIGKFFWNFGGSTRTYPYSCWHVLMKLKNKVIMALDVNRCKLTGSLNKWVQSSWFGSTGGFISKYRIPQVYSVSWLLSTSWQYINTGFLKFVSPKNKVVETLLGPIKPTHLSVRMSYKGQRSFWNDCNIVYISGL